MGSVLKQKNIISVVDDDESVRESLKGLLKVVGWNVETFASGEEFLHSKQLEYTEFLVLDVKLPGISGLEVQKKLTEANYQIPIVFITAHGNEKTRSQAIDGGAREVLLKPFDEEILLSIIQDTLGD